MQMRANSDFMILDAWISSVFYAIFILAFANMICHSCKSKLSNDKINIIRNINITSTRLEP